MTTGRFCHAHRRSDSRQRGRPRDRAPGHVRRAAAGQVPGQGAAIGRRPDGTDYWQYDGNEIPNVGLNAVVGRPPEEYGIEPTSLDDIRVGCYDVHERVRDMSVNGVLGSMCFPSFPQFCGQLFARREDKDEALAMVRAYNDWHIDGWCGAEPGRFIPLSIPPSGISDLRGGRGAAGGKEGLSCRHLLREPRELGWPSLHNSHWNPLWEACADEGTIVCMHLGARDPIGGEGPGNPEERNEVKPGPLHGVAQTEQQVSRDQSKK